MQNIYTYNNTLWDWSRSLVLTEFLSQVTYVNIAVKNQTFPVVIVIWYYR